MGTALLGPQRCHLPLWAKDQLCLPPTTIEGLPLCTWQGGLICSTFSNLLSHLSLTYLLFNFQKLADISCLLVFFSCSLGPYGFNLFYFVAIIWHYFKDKACFNLHLNPSSALIPSFSLLIQNTTAPGLTFLTP